MAASYQLVGLQEPTGNLIEKAKMTTIVYHGPSKTFAMDSMATWTSGAKQHRIENSYKIEDLTQAEIVSYKGDKLIAMCFAGSVNSFERCSDFILNNLHKWTAAMKYIHEMGASFRTQGNVSVILVSDKFTYKFHFDGHGVKVTKWTDDAFVSAGSGSNAAWTAYHVYGASAVDAAKAATFVDEGTGYLIHSLTIVDGKLVPNAAQYITDAKAEVMGLRKRAAKSTAYDMPKRSVELHNRYSHNDDERAEKLKKVREKQEAERKDIEAKDAEKAAEQAAAEKAAKKGKRTKVSKEPEVQETKPKRSRAKSGPLPARP